MSFPDTRRGAGAAAGALAVAALLAFATPAATQDTAAPRRPYRGLFAGQANPNRQFNVQWSTLGVYDDNLTADTAGFNPNVQSGGAYGLLAGGVDLMSRTRHGSTLTTSLHSTARYITGVRQFNLVDAAASLGYQTTFGRSLKLALNQGFSYQPFYQLNFMAAALPATAPATDGVEAPPRSPDSRDLALTPVDTYQYAGSGSLSHSLGRRSTISSDFSYRLTKFANSAQPFFWRQVGAHYTHGLDEHMALRLGYSYGLQQDSTGARVPDTVNQNIDLGVDYGRAVSRSRRTHLTFSSGSSLVEYLNKQYYLVNGNAAVRRELGQTWNLNVAYNRGVQFVEGLNGPLKADGVQTSLTGLLSHRFDVSAFAAASRGQLGLGSTDPGYDSLQAGTSLRYALSRSLSLQAEYQYYFYDFAAGAHLPAGVPATMGRNSVRVGFTGSLPLIGR